MLQNVMSQPTFQKKDYIERCINTERCSALLLDSGPQRSPKDPGPSRRHRRHAHRQEGEEEEEGEGEGLRHRRSSGRCDEGHGVKTEGEELRLLLPQQSIKRLNHNTDSVPVQGLSHLYHFCIDYIWSENLTC